MDVQAPGNGYLAPGGLKGLTKMTAPLQLFVACDGDDGWSGRLPAPNAERTDGPLAELAAARNAIRRLKKESELQGPVEVMVRGGVYPMSEPLRLSPGDSGTEECPVTYRAYADEKPVLSGGRRITGWKPYRDGILQAQIPEVRAGLWHFRQLFYKGRRMIRARRPKYDPANPLYGGWSFVEGLVSENPALRQVTRLNLGPIRTDPDGVGSNEEISADVLAEQIEAPTAVAFDPAPFPAEWEKPGQGEMFVLPGLGWVSDIIPIKSVDYQEHVIHLCRTARPFSQSLGRAMRLTKGNRFYVENMLEDLTEPGEWCLDTDTGTVYFRPPALSEGEGPEGDFDPDDVSAPFADALIRLVGQPGRPVHHVNIRGLTFTQTRTGFPRENAYYKTPNAAQTVYLENAEDCCIEGNRFDAVGGDAIRLQNANARCTIARNAIAHAGAYGIFLGSYQKGFARHDTLSGDVPSPAEWHKYPEDRAPTVMAWPKSREHLIADNHIHHVGVYEKHACGIALFGVSSVDITIRNNSIHNTPRFGIGLMSGFGRVIIEYNDLRYLSEETCDTGGIGSNRWYTWEGDPELARGCIIRFNRIRDVIGCGAYGMKAEPGGIDHAGGRIWAPYYSWGIYFDNAPMDTLVYGNICARNTLGGIMISHFGRNVTVENNIFVDSERSQSYMLFNGPMSDIRVRRNIFSWSDEDADMMCLNLQRDIDLQRVFSEFEGNLYDPPPGAPITFHGSAGEAAKRVGMATENKDLDMEHWCALGFDQNSVVQDPCFVDPENDDYDLRPDSPALARGFEPIDTDAIGVRESGKA